MRRKMKKTAACLLYILLSVSLIAQQQPAQQGAQQQGAQGQQQGAQQQNAGGKSAIPEGYGNLAWGTALSGAKDKIEGKLAYTDDQKVIISRDGELEYYYGFFYMDPAKYEKEAQPAGAQAADAQANDEGKLFYVSLKFPYLSMDTVKQKLIDKYGESSFENMLRGRGAIAWDSDKTIVIMWVDLYEGSSFCRRINYISKETTKELNSYVKAMFNKIEIDVIKKLNP